MEIAGNSHVGKVRKNNEDSFLVDTISDGLALLVVADGVGGHAFGEIASQTSVDIFGNLLAEGKLAAAADPDIRDMLLTMAAQKAHVEVSKRAVEDPSKNGMSCTLTAAVLDAGRVTVLQIGDSRLYRYHEGELTQLTEDQTVARELLQSGRINEAQFSTHPDRSTLSQSIGLEAVGRPLAPVVTSTDWQPGDVVFGCSDGLTDMLSDAQITAVLAGGGSPDELVERLIEAALEAGGKDNVTVALAIN